jgi:hypothetical protein
MLKVLTYFFHVAYPYPTKLRKNNAECGRCVPNGWSPDWNYLFAANAVANDLAIAGSAKAPANEIAAICISPLTALRLNAIARVKVVHGI